MSKRKNQKQKADDKNSDPLENAESKKKFKKEHRRIITTLFKSDKHRIVNVMLPLTDNHQKPGCSDVTGEQLANDQKKQSDANNHN